MKKKERFILGGICFILLIMIFGPWAYNGYQNHQDKVASSSSSKPSKSYTTTGSLKIPEYYTFGENSEYIASSEDIFVGEDYVLRFKAKRSNSSDDYSYRESGEYLKFAYQKIDGDSSSRQTVNLSKLANAYKKGYYLTLHRHVVNSNNKDYLVFFIKKGDNFIPLTFDLENAKVGEYTETIGEIPENFTDFRQNGTYYTSLLKAVTSTTLYTELNYNRQSVMYYILISPDDSTTTSINLFSENSNLQARIDAGKYVFICPRYNQVTPEMWFNDVLHWFAPSGQETLTVYMKDGSDTVKSTPITSYADYLALENEAAS